MIIVRTVARSYGSVYYAGVDFNLKQLRLNRDSWVALLLQDLAEESAVATLEAETVRAVRGALQFLAQDNEASRLLAQPLQQTSAANVRRLFQRSEELADANDTNTRARYRLALRSFIFARAHKFLFAQPIDPQQVRFKPRLPFPRGNPRPLISDLHDIADPRSNVPIGALAAGTAKELADAIKTRTAYDIQRIREACVADLNAGAALRRRAAELRHRPMSKVELSHIREAMLSNHPLRVLKRHGVVKDRILVGVLKVIHADGLATSTGCTYSVPNKKDVRAQFVSGIAPFKSNRLVEIEHRASVEELFAAFQLIQTYVSWNWDAVSSLEVHHLDLETAGIVVFQGFKEKTGDDTPFQSIELSEPGVQTAVEILLWNHAQLIRAGFLDPAQQLLWVTRTRPGCYQREGYFHPVQRLQDFVARHNLPKYSLEQVRTQSLFHESLQKGGIEAARLKGGHGSYATTQRYVGNVFQDRISSALNLEFSKRLEQEIHYLYKGGARKPPRVSLLRPIGDGSMCIDPNAPPPGRSKQPGTCSAEACHLEGGCPNRRIAIDDARVEEVLRLNRHYTENWQRLMQENSERFAVHTLPQMTFNAALLLALQRGPYAARVHQITRQTRP